MKGGDGRRNRDDGFESKTQDEVRKRMKNMRERWKGHLREGEEQKEEVGCGGGVSEEENNRERGEGKRDCGRE